MILKQMPYYESFILITDVPQKQLINDESEFCNAAHVYMFESYLNGIDAKGHNHLFLRASENIARK